MTMRRFALIAGLVAGTLMFGSTAAFADTVTLSGTVNAHTTMSVTRTTGAGNADQLNLYGEGTSNDNNVIKVADIALTANNSQGIELTASSDGTLTSQLLLVDEGVIPAHGDFSSASSVVNVDNTDFNSNAAAQDLYIEYDAPAYVDPGTYSDDITVTISNNELT